MLNKTILIIIYIFSTFQIISQPTVGVLQHTDESLDGYTFFSPFSGTKAWLVDNCGRLVNSWDRGTRPGLAAYFLENGLMFRTYKANPIGPFNSASNAGGLELVDWDNNTVWSYEWNTATELSHHDAVMMPNGNILALTWELVYEEELVELGRNPDEIAAVGFMWSERIVEIEPIGTDEINIVWEWHIKDHYIQDFDETKLNFGVIAEHPELFNINLPDLDSNNSHSSRDWNHFNAIDYNEELDQILISVRNSDEIWIIDHSTTTQEAASHDGGTYGKGGDILYRWGNASAYDRAPVSAQKFFGQHGAHWIREGLDNEGQILIFNNGNGRPGPDFSTVEILTPNQDSIGGYILPETASFGPALSEKIYGNFPDEDFYSAFLSNAQQLANGNFLVNAGSIGTTFEINENREIVWEYIIPLQNDAPLTQGWNPNNNWTFRVYKYPPDYQGFENVDLMVGEVIEIGGNPIECEISTNTNLIEKEANIAVNFYSENGVLEISNLNNQFFEVNIFDALGRNYFREKNIQKDYYAKSLMLPKGIFFVNIRTENRAVFTNKIIHF